MVVYTVEAVTALFANIENMGGKAHVPKTMGFRTGDGVRVEDV
jgi:hypothetical protein